MTAALPMTTLVVVVGMMVMMMMMTTTTGLTFNKVRLITTAPNGNMLFRSDYPGNANGTFALDLLLEYMERRAEEAGVHWPPSPPYVVDVTLLNEPHNRKEIAEEERFFAAHPSAGEVVYMSTHGSITNPMDFPPDVRDTIADGLDFDSFDRLPERIPAIHKLLTQDSPTPRVVLLHCIAGDDRTGEVAGSYVMKYLGAPSFEDVLYWDDRIAHGSNTSFILLHHAYAMEWYCFWLQQHEGMALTCEYDWPRK